MNNIFILSILYHRYIYDATKKYRLFKNFVRFFLFLEKQDYLFIKNYKK